MRARSLRRSAFFPVAGPLLLGLAALALSDLALPPVASGDIQAPPRARALGERRLQRRADSPPSALPEATAVEQGGSVEIILHAEGQVGKMIYFLVRNPPKHGTISGQPVQISRNSATVTYVHNPGDDASDDEFTFCAQAGGSAVSAPETVRVRILPAAPIIEVTPPELDFGAVKAGEGARAEFTLQNRGGSEASGRVEPPSPWAVDGPAEYHLARGASQTFRLVFRPQNEEVYTNELHFQFEARNGVRLVGTGLLDAAQKAALASAAAAEAARSTNPAASGSVAASGSGTRGGLGAGNNGPAGSNGASAPAVGGATAGAGRLAGGAAPVPNPALGSGSSRPGTTANASPNASGGNPGSAGQPGHELSLANNDDTSVILNEANVERVDVREVDGSSVELAWMPPVPTPAGYRVEVRYLSIEPDDKLRIDWRPYAQTKLNVRRDAVTARLYNLPLGGFQMLRVVAVDSAGQLSAPSPMITVLMPQPPTWWHPTPMKILVTLLALCLFLVVRRRLEDRAILREIDESRAESNKEAGIAWKA